jgi:hypothetical protein
MLRKSTIPQLLLTFLMLTVPGCSSAATSTTQPPTAVAVTVDVSTEEAVVTATATVILTSTVTPALEKVMLTFTKDAFCRKGPSVQYFDVGSFNQGDTTQAEGRNDTDPRWWYVLMANGVEHCWVSESTVQPRAEAEALPIQLAEKALPETPSDFSIINRVCKAGGFANTLGWTASSNVDGYYVYLNGEQIQDIVKETQTSYINKAPMNQPITYELEAYNNIGFGERVLIEDPGCP